MFCNNSDYILDKVSNVWFIKRQLTPTLIRKKNTICKVDMNGKGYNIEENEFEFREKMKSFEEYKPKISKKELLYSKFLGDITWGCEYETSVGNMPDYYQYRYGLVGCKDGSISSAEWVTVPMKGAKGLNTIKNLCKALTEHTNIDINCSLHIHIGSIPTSRDYLCSLYMLCYHIQDELFKMFPYYKTDPAGVRHKNYCQKLERKEIYPLKSISKKNYTEYIDSCWEKIFIFLSDGKHPDNFVNKKQMKHPIAKKWDRKSRYYWINLQNMLFSPRQTAEFRLHTPTINFQKSINWLFICNAIIKYAESNMKHILTTEDKISVLDVLNYYRNNYKSEEACFLSDYLIAYYNERCSVFAKDLLKRDPVSAHEYENDKEYSFEFKGVKELF